MINSIKSEFYKSWHDPLTLISCFIWFALAVGINITHPANKALGQMEVMGFLMPLLPCLTVGAGWAKEFGDGTLKYTLIQQSNKTRLFISKFICTIANILIQFSLYSAGLLLSGWQVFSDGSKVVELYITPALLLVAHTMVHILIACTFKSFSYLGLSSVVLFLFGFFCYKMTDIYHTARKGVGLIAQFTFSSIQAYAYMNPDINILILRCMGYLCIGLVCSTAALVGFLRRDV